MTESKKTALNEEADILRSLGSKSFRNPEFLQAEGLGTVNVMDYFYQSPFYLELNPLANALNDKLRRNEISKEEIPYSSGFLFELVWSSDDANKGLWWLHTAVFIIQRFRYSPIKHASDLTPNHSRMINSSTVPNKNPLQVFYVMSGTIYKAPTVGNILENHFSCIFDDLIGLVRECRSQLSSFLTNSELSISTDDGIETEIKLHNNEKAYNYNMQRAFDGNEIDDETSLPIGDAKYPSQSNRKLGSLEASLSEENIYIQRLIPNFSGNSFKGL